MPIWTYMKFLATAFKKRNVYFRKEEIQLSVFVNDVIACKKPSKESGNNE